MSYRPSRRRSAEKAPEGLLRRLPKVELHRHLEGSARPSTVRDLAAANGVALPSSGVRPHLGPTRLPDALDTACAALVGADDFHRVAYESTRDAAAAGVVYTEVFVSPYRHLSRGVPFRVLWDGVTRGLRDAEADTGVAARVIINVDKAAGPGPALEQLVMAEGDTTGYLVGIGGDGAEEGVDNTALRPVFERAAERGLRRTLHAGKFESKSVAEAIRELGCERIDHGPLVVDDNRLRQQAADRGIGFTVCPTSDVVLSGVFGSVAGHTLPTMLDNGLLVSLASDAPAVTGADVADEYETVLALGLTDLEGLRRIALNGVAASWLPEDERQALRERVSAAWDGALFASPALTTA